MLKHVLLNSPVTLTINQGMRPCIRWAAVRCPLPPATISISVSLPPSVPFLSCCHSLSSCCFLFSLSLHPPFPFYLRPPRPRPHPGFSRTFCGCLTSPLWSVRIPVIHGEEQSSSSALAPDLWISEYSDLAWDLVYFFWLLMYNTYNTSIAGKLNMLHIYNTECDYLHEHHSPEIILIKFGCTYLNYFPLHIYTDVVNKCVPSVISA